MNKPLKKTPENNTTQSTNDSITRVANPSLTLSPTPWSEIGETDAPRKRKHGRQSLYIPKDVLHEVIGEAFRLDRSLSWVFQMAWKISRAQIEATPTVEDVVPRLREEK